MNVTHDITPNYTVCVTDNFALALNANLDRKSFKMSSSVTHMAV